MNDIQPVARQDQRSFCELVRYCEIYAITSRIAAAVARFFIEIGNIVFCCRPRRELQAQRIAAPLIQPGMNRERRIEIIEAIAAIPPNERESVATLACQLINGRLDVPHQTWRRELIRTVAAIPAHERDDVIQRVRRLVTSEKHDAEKLWMVETVVAIPAHERDNVVQRALGRITPEMFANDILMMIAGAAGPGAALVHHPAPAQGINVHEGDRDRRVRAAVQLLYQRQGFISQITIDQAADDFIIYLYNSLINEKDTQRAIDALLKPREQDEVFGPLIDEEGFVLEGLQISGIALIGRFWIFASQLAEPEQTNAKKGMLSALKDSYDFGGRVCNQGKTQRLVVSVLSGYLEGVNIEGAIIPDQVPRAQAMQMFFNIEAHRAMDIKRTALLNAAKQFYEGNPGVKKQEFIEDINNYAIEQEIPSAKEEFLSIEAHKKILIKQDLLGAANAFCDLNPGIDRATFLADIEAHAAEKGMAQTA